MEAVDGGWAQLVGTDTARIVAAAKGVLDGTSTLPGGGNPFGDGASGRRSAEAIEWLLGLGPRPAPFDVTAVDLTGVDVTG
jgi:UDP-N-acetylglucosamine 2-epimerase (non-hydrolysing)